MPLNSYVTLGRSGLRVSPFCLGAMTWFRRTKAHGGRRGRLCER